MAKLFISIVLALIVFMFATGNIKAQCWGYGDCYSYRPPMGIVIHKVMAITLALLISILTTSLNIMVIGLTMDIMTNTTDTLVQEDNIIHIHNRDIGDVLLVEAIIMHSVKEYTNEWAVLSN